MDSSSATVVPVVVRVVVVPVAVVGRVAAVRVARRTGCSPWVSMTSKCAPARSAAVQAGAEPTVAWAVMPVVRAATDPAGAAATVVCPESVHARSRKASVHPVVRRWVVRILTAPARHFDEAEFIEGNAGPGGAGSSPGDAGAQTAANVGAE